MTSTDTTTNIVTLGGRVSQEPVTKTLPSGDQITQFRVVVDRPARLRRRTGQSVDTFDCVAWTAALRKKSVRLTRGTVVEVSGRLRRRFTRYDGKTVSWVTIDLSAIRRGDSGT